MRRNYLLKPTLSSRANTLECVVCSKSEHVFVCVIWRFNKLIFTIRMCCTLYCTELKTTINKKKQSQFIPFQTNFFTLCGDIFPSICVWECECEWVYMRIEYVLQIGFSSMKDYTIWREFVINRITIPVKGMDWKK